MELNDDLLDTVELTARLRRHPRFAKMRTGFIELGLDPECCFLLTLDGSGPGRGEGLLVTYQGQANRFEFRDSRFWLSPPLADAVIAGDDHVIQALAIARSPAAWQDFQRRVADFTIGP